MTEVINATVAAPQARIAIVVSRFNEFVNNSLVDGAIDALTRIGQVNPANIHLIKVPGAYEIPLAVTQLANKKDSSDNSFYDGIVALGSVIRGSTSHYEYVAGPLASSLVNISVNTNIPVGFGVLTVESIEQAIERAGTKHGNKGAEVALVTLEMINVKKHIAQL